MSTEPKLSKPKKKGRFRKLIRIGCFVANIVVAAALLLSYLCCFVAPEKVWWIGFFGLAYMYLLAANICFIVIWSLSRKKKFALISLIAVLAGWGMTGRNFQAFEKKLPETEAGNGIKVLTFNIHMFQQRDVIQPDEMNLNIFDFLRKSDADIVCMQEFMTSQWVKELNGKELEKKFAGTPYRHLELSMGNVGIATFSKYPIVRKKLLYSDNTTNACIFSDVAIGSDTVRVFNVHLKSNGFNEEERALLDNVVKREYTDSDVRTVKAIIRQMKGASFRRARQVDLLVEHIEKSPYPVIICGDFNDPPLSYSYQKIRGERKDAFAEAGSGRSTTYNIGRVSSQRIDYIMYSPDFDAYDYESPRVILSDHFPVMCRLVKK